MLVNLVEAADRTLFPLSCSRIEDLIFSFNRKLHEWVCQTSLKMIVEIEPLAFVGMKSILSTDCNYTYFCPRGRKKS